MSMRGVRRFTVAYKSAPLTIGFDKLLSGEARGTLGDSADGQRAELDEAQAAEMLRFQDVHLPLVADIDVRLILNDRSNPRPVAKSDTALLLSGAPGPPRRHLTDWPSETKLGL